MPPTFPPEHVRASMIGDLPDGEMFSCNFSIRPTIQALPDPNALEAIGGQGDPLGVGDSPFERVRDAVVAFWANPTAMIHPKAVLRRVKLAAIGDDGAYMGAPVESAENVIGGAEEAWGGFPHQMSRKVTLETDGDLGRVKGGFYLPAPSAFHFNYDTDLFDATQTGDLADVVKGFLDDVQGDVLGADIVWEVVIASAGRHNPDGTVRTPPTLHTVKRVNVGRRIDVQRRRANKLREARIQDRVLAGF